MSTFARRARHYGNTGATVANSESVIRQMVGNRRARQGLVVTETGQAKVLGRERGLLWFRSGSEVDRELGLGWEQTVVQHGMARL